MELTKRFLSSIDYNGCGKVVAYQNVKTGHIITSNEYYEILYTELIELWHVIGKFGKEKYGTFENFCKCMLEIPDTEYIPLYRI